MMFVVFFFFKQKTAYEMRISDWSSDVCSSDLLGRGAIDLDWGLHGERVVGAFAVELADKIIETGLLLQDVGAGRAGRLLLQRQVHALVAAVLLRLAWFDAFDLNRSEEHTSELQSLMRISFAVFCLKKKKNTVKR